jgi:hypothetical protein
MMFGAAGSGAPAAPSNCGGDRSLAPPVAVAAVLA